MALGRREKVLVVGLTALFLIGVIGYTMMTREPEYRSHYSLPEITPPELPEHAALVKQNITLHPTDDSKVESASPDENYGSNTSLEAGDEGAGATLWSFIKFDILGAIPASANIISAKLRLYAYSISTYGAYNFRICRVLGEWDESTITWNNKPDVDEANPYYQANREAPPDDSWVEYDVKQYVEDVLAQGQDYGLALIAEDNGNDKWDYVVYASKDYDGRAPELVIECEYPATDSWALIYGSLGVSVVLIVAAAWLLKKPRIRGGGKKR